MVKANILFKLTSVVALLFVAAPAFAQDDGACAPCSAAATALSACPGDDVACICAPQVVTDVAGCAQCVADAGVDTSAIPGFEAISGHAALCEALNSTTSTTTATTSSSTESTTSASTTRSVTNTATIAAPKEAASTVTAPPLNTNSASAFGLSLSIAVAAAGLSLSLGM